MEENRYVIKKTIQAGWGVGGLGGFFVGGLGGGLRAKGKPIKH